MLTFLLRMWLLWLRLKRTLNRIYQTLPPFEGQIGEQVRNIKRTKDAACSNSVDLNAIHNGWDSRKRVKHQPIRLPKEIVLSHWDPHLYRSKIWPAACLFGASFGALHLISWNIVFPTTIELWLWRTSAFVSILSMIIFMHFKMVVFRWGGPLTIISLVSPGLYFVSRVEHQRYTSIKVARGRIVMEVAHSLFSLAYLPH